MGPMDGQLTDVADVDTVEMQISADGTRIWINIDGVCRFRVSQTKIILVKDDRTEAVLRSQHSRLTLRKRKADAEILGDAELIEAFAPITGSPRRRDLGR
jgi:hypothetical protein